MHAMSLSDPPTRILYPGQLPRVFPVRDRLGYGLYEHEPVVQVVPEMLDDLPPFYDRNDGF